MARLGGDEFVVLAAIGEEEVADSLTERLQERFDINNAQANLPYTWQLILGGTLLVIILFAPGGIWSFVERFTSKRHTPTIGEEGDAA